MKSSISFRQYRTIDLFLFTVILFFSEWITVRASSSWFADQLYVVSPVAAVTCIVMMRWGPFALLPAALGGAFFCLIAGGGAVQLGIYTLGNLAALAALVFFRIRTKEEIRQDTTLTLLMAASVQVLMLAGRALMALILGQGTEAAIGLITTDILSLIFTLVILWIARRVNGLFEDQKHYLFRIQRESDDRPAENPVEPYPSEESSGRGKQP